MSDCWQATQMIDELKRQFAEQRGKNTIELTPEGLETILESLTNIRMAVRCIENEVSRHRWNEGARLERKQAEEEEAIRIITETARAGSNVVLFAPEARAFSDGGRP